MPSVGLLHSAIGDANRGGALVPSGTVFAFAGTAAPSGWLLCDGTAYNQTDYASLFAAIGSTYNTQTNPTTNAAWAAPSAGQFRVPDYRGVFLRSSGQASGQSAVAVGGHQGQATAKNGLSVNTTSEANFSELFYRGHYAWEGVGTLTGLAGGRWQLGVAGGEDTKLSSFGGNHNHGISGDSETRPINKGVLYIIKV